MLLQLYTYLKPRSAFGKQCIFSSSGPVAVEDVYPQPSYFHKYIFRDQVHRGIQNCTQFAVHDVQVQNVQTKSTSMLHVEGGWPREINPKDTDVVQRFRRRVEKEDNWNPRVMNLIEKAEKCILQNNAINIYQNPFDDMVPAHLRNNYNVRTTNVYDDPEKFPRPVSHLSWSPGSNKIAASYAFSEMEFESTQSQAKLLSYIWDIVDPNKPLMSLNAESPVMVIEFNPRDPSMLVGGLMCGKVCNWDLRIGDKPVQSSHHLHSHRSLTNQVVWTSSKCNCEFFSSSPGGMIKWWDVRKLVTPTCTLIVDLDEPARGDVSQAVGVTAIQFDAAMGSKFLAGLQNGIVLSVNRKAPTAAEKLAIRFDCHIGPVLAVERNPFNLSHFLTIGDWCAKVWADDTREGSVLSLCGMQGDATGGCWSRSRNTVFFTINTAGMLEVHDILAGARAPLITFRVCQDSLTAIAPHEDGHLLVVGSRGGGIYLIECTEAIISPNTKMDKSELAAYLERESRFTKIVENRLKEVRMMQRTEEVEEVSEKATPLWKLKEKQKARRKSGASGMSKRRESDKSKSKDSEKLKDKGDKKRHRSRKTTKALPYATDPELVALESDFHRAVDEEFLNYPEFEAADREFAVQGAHEHTGRRGKQGDAAAAQKPGKKKERKGQAAKPKKKLKSGEKSVERRKKVESEDDLVAEIEVEPEKPKKKVRRRKHLETCPFKICDPAVCCMDVEGPFKPLKGEEDKAEKPSTSKAPSNVRPFFIKEKWFRRLSEFINSMPERSPTHKRQMLLAKVAPPHFLREEVERAKRHLNLWQKKLARGRRASWIVEQRPSRKLKRIYDAGSVVESKSVETQDTASRMDSRASIRSALIRRRRSKRRGRKSQATLLEQQEEVEEEPPMALDWDIAQKVDAIDKKELEGDTVVYPRISAAFQPRTDDEEQKSTVQIIPL